MARHSFVRVGPSIEIGKCQDGSIRPMHRLARRRPRLSGVEEKTRGGASAESASGDAANALGAAYCRIAAERIADLRFKDMPGPDPGVVPGDCDGLSFPRLGPFSLRDAATRHARAYQPDHSFEKYTL